MPREGLIGSVHAVAVELTLPHSGNVPVPDVRGDFGKTDARFHRRRVARVEQAELDRGRVLRVEREVGALSIEGRTLG